MDANDARVRAQAALDLLYLGDNVVLDDAATVERDRGWTFFYNTKAFVASRDPHDGLLAASPFVVDRTTGEVLHPGSAPRQEEERRIARGATAMTVDLPPGLVEHGLGEIVTNSVAVAQPWRGELESADPFQIPLPHFDPHEVNPLTPATTKLEDAVGPVDTSGASMAKTVGLTMATYANPITAGTDAYQTAKIRDLQKAFLDGHQNDLTALGNDLNGLWENLGQLIEVLRHAPTNLDGIAALIDEKAKYGNDMYQQVVSELASPDLPEGTRVGLQQAKADLETFFAERDARVEADREEFRSLQVVVGQVAAMASAQADLAQQVKLGKSPGNTVGGTAAQPNVRTIIETTHVHPDALHYVADVHTMLLGMHVGMDLALLPPPPPPPPPPPVGEPSSAPNEAPATDEGPPRFDSLQNGVWIEQQVM